MSMGSTLKDLRIQHGYSMDDVARHINVSKSVISKYENGNAKFPSYDIIQKLANLYGTTPEYIRGTDTNKELDVNKIVELCEEINQKPYRERTLLAKMINALIDTTPDEQ